jgi:hypothetical protein
LLLLVVGCSDGDGLAVLELSGEVRDDFSGAPIEGATVLFTSDTLLRESTTTDSDGHFEMALESDAVFGQVRAERAGYEPRERTVFFDVPSRRIDLRLRAVPPGG